MEREQIPPVTGGGTAQGGTTLLLSDDDVRRACDMPAMVKTMESALADAHGPQLAMPPRSNLATEGTFLRVMPAIMGRAGVLGLKMFHGSLERGVRYLVVLCDIETGAVTAVVDGAYLTAARTGATAGVATKHLARDDSGTVGVIGAGLEARTNLAAVAAVRKIDKVQVFSPRAFRRESFADQMGDELGVEVLPVDTAEAAVTGMDIVVVATNTGSGGPVAYRGAWVEPGQHIVSIGSTTPALREIDAATFTRADAVFFDGPADAIAEESGDVLAWQDVDAAAAAGVATLTQLLCRQAEGRRHPDDVTVFKSVGAATQDLAGAVAVCEAARTLGIGTEVSSVAALKTF